MHHWTEKAAAPLLAILSSQKRVVTEIAPEEPLTAGLRRRVMEHQIHTKNLYLWPFRFGDIPESPKTTDTNRELAREYARLGPRIQETTNEYITPIHFGQLFPGGRELGDCPITIDAEGGFVKHLNELMQSYMKTRSSRRPAVLRKISHAVISWWGIVYGAWPGTKNQFTIDIMSWDEIADVYDCFCFADCRKHTREQTRKLITRLIEDIKRTYPTCPQCSAPMVFLHDCNRHVSSWGSASK